MKVANFLYLVFTFTGNLLVLPVAHGRAVPDSLQKFYNQVKGGSCPIVLKKGLSKDTSNKGGFRYCSDTDETLMWIAGSSSLADMDVDCDGINNAKGKCENDPTGQSITAFQDEVSAFGIEDLDANLHSYVVLGTKSFDPREVGVESLSVVAVVCNDKLFYGVWGDTNADNLVGEASISLATACFGDHISGDNGHSETDVLYLAFRSHKAKPSSNVNWKAKSFGDFEESLARIGDALIAKFLPGDHTTTQGDNNSNNGGSENGANTGNGGNSSSGETPGMGFNAQIPNVVFLLSFLIIPLMFYLSV